jgi:hypothetical protein
VRVPGAVCNQPRGSALRWWACCVLDRSASPLWQTQWTPLAPLTPDAGLFCAVILRAVQPAVVLSRWVCRASQLGKPDGRDLAPAPLWRGLCLSPPSAEAVRVGSGAV